MMPTTTVQPPRLPEPDDQLRQLRGWRVVGGQGELYGESTDDTAVWKEDAKGKMKPGVLLRIQEDPEDQHATQPWSGTGWCPHFVLLPVRRHDTNVIYYNGLVLGYPTDVGHHHSSETVEMARGRRARPAEKECLRVPPKDGQAPSASALCLPVPSLRRPTTTARAYLCPAPSRQLH